MTKSFSKIFLFFFILFLVNNNISSLYAESNSIQVDLGVGGCNNNGVCEPSEGENSTNCPVDCAVPVPPPEHGGNGNVIGTVGEELFIYNLSVEPSFTSAMVYWNSSVSTISTIKWGKTPEVKEGTLSSVIFARNHKVEIINLKPGTLYYFIIESKDVNGRTNISSPTYFFTKFLKDTTFPSNPTNVQTSAGIPGITISWKNPSDENFSYIRIMRHEDRFRGDPFSGKLIYEGRGEKFLDKNVVPGKKYFYVLFSRDTEGNFSSGVGAAETAYSLGKIISTEPTKEELPVVSISTTYFAHQYNQEVEPLTSVKNIKIFSNKGTVIDTDLKAFSDDWMEVKNEDGQIIGKYLFSFNKDSGRYQSVIPPLEKDGIYSIKIYRYKDNVLTIISEGSLEIKNDIAIKVEKTYNESFFVYFIYAISLFLILFLLVFLLKRRQKTQ